MAEMKPVFKPDRKTEEKRAEDYDFLQQMRDLKLKPMPHFAGHRGQRSWLRYIDDSERVLNGYQLSREDQGKEEWQSNLMDNITLAKCRAIAAGVGLKVPDMAYNATNKKGMKSPVPAEIFKNIVEHSFNDGNPSLHTFLQVWQLMCHGVLFEYEGYRTGGAKVRRVKSFDSVSGEVEVEEKFVKFEGKPYSVILNPQDFYWWDFKIRDLQDQKRVAWVQNYGKKDLEMEFSKYKNYKYIQDKDSVQESTLQDTLYYTKWKDNVEDKEEYEVFRIYDQERDVYRVWVNGVPIIDAPLLWGGDEKIYPFAKQINQSFANTNFFVGMSWPAILESYQDHKNTSMNTLIDKTYRSSTVPMLVGLQNKDLFEVEDQFVTQDNRYYVPDVNQVREYPIQGVNQGELAMLNALNQGIELMSVDRSQQGIDSGGDKTAREAIINDARAQELKGSLFLALEDHWLQKTRIRNEVILTHYLKDKAAQKEKKNQIISIKDYAFADGVRGILDIHIAKTRDSRLSLREIEARERAMEEQGVPYKLISLPASYLNEWEYDYQIIPMSFHNQSMLAEEEKLQKEIQMTGLIAPEELAANKKIFIERIRELYGQNTEDYQEPPEPEPTTLPDGTVLGLTDNENENAGQIPTSPQGTR